MGRAMDNQNLPVAQDRHHSGPDVHADWASNRRHWPSHADLPIVGSLGRTMGRLGHAVVETFWRTDKNKIKREKI